MGKNQIKNQLKNPADMKSTTFAMSAILAMATV